MFQRITITIDLSHQMDADMPTSGTGEMEAIDKHSAVIDRMVTEPLRGLVDELRSLGYIVDVDA